MSDYKFESTLLADDVFGEMKDNEYELMDLIPELKDMVGFDQNGYNHHSDLWNRTLNALAFSAPDIEVRMALLLEGIGKPHSYKEENGVKVFQEYSEVSSDMARNILKRLHFSDKCIGNICYLIENQEKPMDKDLIADENMLLKLDEVKNCDKFAQDMCNNPKKNDGLEKVKRILLTEGDYIL